LAKWLAAKYGVHGPSAPWLLTGINFSIIARNWTFLCQSQYQTQHIIHFFRLY